MALLEVRVGLLVPLQMVPADKDDASGAIEQRRESAAGCVVQKEEIPVRRLLAVLRAVCIPSNLFTISPLRVGVTDLYGRVNLSAQRWVNSGERHRRFHLVPLPKYSSVACAEKIVSATLDTCFAPNRTMRELHELMKSGAAIDPVKNFSEAPREELRVRL